MPLRIRPEEHLYDLSQLQKLALVAVEGLRPDNEIAFVCNHIAGLATVFIFFARFTFTDSFNLGRMPGEVALAYGDDVYVTPEKKNIHRFDTAGVCIR